MRIGVLALPGVQLLEVVGPLDVFSEAGRLLGRPVYEPLVLGIEQGPIAASSGLRLMADRALSATEEALDTLLVAGGPEMGMHPIDSRVCEWLIQRAPTVRRFGAVCSGVFALAEAGLLDGCRVTTHWQRAEQLAKAFPNVTVEPDLIWTRDGRFYTSAGGSAGMDLALALVEEDFGRELALKVARTLVLFLKRPGGQSQFSAHLAAQMAERTGIQDIQSWVLANLASDHSVATLARRAAMSPRHFARVFKSEVGMTPAEYVEAARVDAARRMLEDQDRPVKGIADVCGFYDTNGLRRAFLRRVGVSPSDYRQRFRSETPRPIP